MIDIDSQVFDRISKAIEAVNAKAYVTGEYTNTPARFPCVSIVEESNVVFRHTQSSDGQENHAYVMYEVNVYSNRKSGKKAEARSLISVIDNEFHNLGFTRVMGNPIMNMFDDTIYRYVLRYRAVVGQNGEIYRTSMI